jgi:hypothetical protein
MERRKPGLKALSIAKWQRIRYERIAAKEGFGWGLAGLCCRASADVFRALKKAGFSPTLVLADCHGWVELDGWIIDITATQFERLKARRVHVASSGSYRGEHWADHPRRFQDVEEARRTQVKLGWPYDQTITKE